MSSISPADIGRRVVVRYRLREPDAGASATDVVGRLTEWEAGLLHIETKAGGLVEVSEDDVLVAKVVPPVTVTRRAIRDLEAAAARGWRALEMSTLGGWLLRASAGFTRRANSCLPLSDPGAPLEIAVDRVEQWYDARGLVPAFQVPQRLAGRLDEVLDSRGWLRHPEDVLVLTAPVAPLEQARRPGLPAVAVAPEPDDSWLACYHYRGAPLPPQARQVLVNAELAGFASVTEHGRVVAIARGAVTDSPAGRRWLGVTAVEVDPAERRRGLASHVLAGLAAWAAPLGATDVYVQVSADNAGALAVYERLGFIEHHRYHYRRSR